MYYYKSSFTALDWQRCQSQGLYHCDGSAEIRHKSSTFSHKFAISMQILKLFCLFCLSLKQKLYRFWEFVMKIEQNVPTSKQIYEKWTWVIKIPIDLFIWVGIISLKRIIDRAKLWWLWWLSILQRRARRKSKLLQTIVADVRCVFINERKNINKIDQCS